VINKTRKLGLCNVIKLVFLACMPGY